MIWHPEVVMTRCSKQLKPELCSKCQSSAGFARFFVWNWLVPLFAWQLKKAAKTVKCDILARSRSLLGDKASARNQEGGAQGRTNSVTQILPKTEGYFWEIKHNSCFREAIIQKIIVFFSMSIIYEMVTPLYNELLIFIILEQMVSGEQWRQGVCAGESWQQVFLGICISIFCSVIVSMRTVFFWLGPVRGPESRCRIRRNDEARQRVARMKVRAKV